MLGRTSYLAGVVIPRTESKVPMAIHGRHGDEKGVDADVFRQDPGRLMEVAWNVGERLVALVLRLFFDQSTLDFRDEHTIGMNAVGQFVAQKSLAGNTRGLKVVDHQIIDFARGGSVRECLE